MQAADRVLHLNDAYWDVLLLDADDFEACGAFRFGFADIDASTCVLDLDASSRRDRISININLAGLFSRPKHPTLS